MKLTYSEYGSFELRNLKKLRYRVNRLLFVKLATGVHNRGKKLWIDPYGNLDTRINQWNKSIKALIDFPALTARSMNDRLSISPQVQRRSDLCELVGQPLLVNFCGEVAFNKQPLPENVRSNVSYWRFVHNQLIQAHWITS